MATVLNATASTSTMRLQRAVCEAVRSSSLSTVAGSHVCLTATCSQGPKAFAASRPQRVQRLVCQAAAGTDASRRQALQLLAVPALAAVLPAAANAAKGPKGFNPVQDLNDNYQFLYPFGWQEVAVQGADVVYKDVVEPLESVSVTITPTDRKDITEFGEVQEVSNTLAKQVLTSPDQEVELINSEERETNGHKYYEFEFTAKTGRYTRHSLAVVTVNDGRFYTLTTGANERRWGKMKDKLKTTVRSFGLVNL